MTGADRPGEGNRVTRSPLQILFGLLLAVVALAAIGGAEAAQSDVVQVLDSVRIPWEFRISDDPLFGREVAERYQDLFNRLRLANA